MNMSGYPIVYKWPSAGIHRRLRLEHMHLHGETLFTVLWGRSSQNTEWRCLWTYQFKTHDASSMIHCIER